MDDSVFKKVIFSVLLLAALGATVSVLLKPNPILVGVLHSQTGTMAFSEKGVLQATLAAIDSINAQGGVLGRPLKAVVRDGASDPKVFAEQAQQLLTQDKVAVIFGGWTSASRKAMLPVLEKQDGLLFYPVQYEGIEQSPNIIYMGMTPNQQLYPALTYMTQTFGKKVLLIGSDYIYPRITNAIAHPVLAGIGASVCGETYLPLGSQNTDALGALVKQCKPDYIVNSVNGDSNVALLKALRAAGDKTPILSLSLSEPEMRRLIGVLGEAVTLQHYASRGYFQSLDTPENHAFVQQLQGYMPDAAINHPMKMAWDGVHLWANAVHLVGGYESKSIANSLEGMSYSSATGPVVIDVDNRHLWQKSYIGELQRDGNFTIVWQSQGLVEPNPWSLGHSPAAWQVIEQDWYRQWGEQWQAP